MLIQLLLYSFSLHDLMIHQDQWKCPQQYVKAAFYHLNKGSWKCVSYMIELITIMVS